MIERGELRNPAFAFQDRTYDGCPIGEFAFEDRTYKGLAMGKCTPTDIDCFMELRGRFFVFAEAKLNGKALDRGQQLAFERLVDAVHCPGAGRWAAFIVVDHGPESKVDYASCPVRCYRWYRRWMHPPARTTLREKVERLYSLSHTPYRPFGGN